MKRTYKVSKNQITGRTTITLSVSNLEVSFNVWRDVMRLAGYSSTSLPRKVEVFEFLWNDPKRIAEAERILQGALFQKEV